VLLLRESLRRDKSTIVDSFPGDVCPPPVTHFHCLSLGAITMPPVNHVVPTNRMCHVFARALDARHFTTSVVEKKLSQTRTPECAIPRRDSDPMVLPCFGSNGLDLLLYSLQLRTSCKPRNLVWPPNS
jgi:hypothetical protein